jgi:membrane fusion protein, multidrug efflux system
MEMDKHLLAAAPLLLLVAGGLAGCKPETPAARAPARVVAQVARLTSYAPGMALTGAIEARTLSDLSFRVSGRVIERTVDVGAHVEADQVLARVDTQQQQANLDSAQATVEAAQAKLAQDLANFDRQKTLIEKGFTTQKDYDAAEEAYRTSLNSVEGAKAQLATSRDLFSYTELRAPAAGTITDRTIEAGQVVQAASTAFTIALDGPRDAVFDIYEATVAKQDVSGPVSVTLVADPKIVAIGHIREISPTIDQATGAVRVKVGIDAPPPAMTLGAVVSWAALFKPSDVIALPWPALASIGGRTAVWTVDPQSAQVTQKPVEIAAYRTGELLVKSGLAPGEIVVTAGAQLLRPGQVVSFDKE